MCAPLLQSCPTLCYPMDYGPPGFFVDRILQTRVLEWVACLLQGIFPTQGSNPCLLSFLHWQVGSLPQALPGKPMKRPEVLLNISWLGKHWGKNVLISSFLQQFTGGQDQNVFLYAEQRHFILIFRQKDSFLKTGHCMCLHL